MDIFLSNTLGGKKEKFTPIVPGKVGIYSCGPTVYDRVHIGNLRSFTFADLLRRMFEMNGYEVNHVRNITDVDDKTIKRSQKEHIALLSLTETYEQIFQDDLAALNILPVTHSTKATEHVEDMIALIEKLIANGSAYKADDGVYFSIAKAKDYGALVNLKLEEGHLKERIQNDEYDKENPQDFALWKFWTEADGETAWEAPFGKGRPGWHVECSAMAMKYLGETFDIHTGGIDLAFPHHTNEIAQSESATGKPFVHYWLHNAFVNVADTKMAKSAGNFTTLGSIVEKGIAPLAYRYWLLTAHYQTQVNFTWEALEASEVAQKRLISHLADISDDAGIPNAEYWKRFLAFINDDLDTPKAVALIWELLKDDSVSAEDQKATILNFDKVLGLNLEAASAEMYFKIPEEAQKLIDEREGARKAKDWAKADELRKKIEGLGFELKDTEKGPRLTKL